MTEDYELSQLREQYPTWNFGTVWATAARSNCQDLWIDLFAVWPGWPDRLVIFTLLSPCLATSVMPRRW